MIWDLSQERFVAPLEFDARFRLDQGEVDVVEYENDQITLSVRAPAAGTLLVAEPWYPGWTAEIDGQSTHVEQANGWLRAIDVPAGAQEVVLQFRQNGLRWGAILSLIAWGFVGWFWRRP